LLAEVQVVAAVAVAQAAWLNILHTQYLQADRYQ
jgi:hypothetical protein